MLGVEGEESTALEPENPGEHNIYSSFLNIKSR